MRLVAAVTLGLAWLAAVAAADLTPGESDLTWSDGPDPRFFFLNNSTGSSLSVSVGSLAAVALTGLLVVGLLVLLMMLLTLLVGEEETGYSGSSGSSGYSGSSRDDVAEASQWRSLAALDWIALAEELYESTAELGSGPCQRRLVCQLQRSAPAALDYLPYLQLLQLPEPLRQLVSSYSQAARASRSGEADCEQLFPECGFSVGRLVDKYGQRSS